MLLPSACLPDSYSDRLPWAADSQVPHLNVVHVCVEEEEGEKRVPVTAVTMGSLWMLAVEDKGRWKWVENEMDGWD
jgi:hypothetical protein